MARVRPLLFVGAIVISYLAGYATRSAGTAEAQGTQPAGPKWTRIPLTPDQGQPLHWSADDLKKAHAALVVNPRSPISSVLSLPITRTHMFSLRHSGGGEAGAEQHDGVSELHIIVAGSATATLGGDIENKQASATQPGEYRGRGDAIKGGRTFRITAGDVVNVPPGAAHSYSPDGPEGITYMIVKINVGLYPWSLVAGATLP